MELLKIDQKSASLMKLSETTKAYWAGVFERKEI